MNSSSVSGKAKFNELGKFVVGGGSSSQVANDNISFIGQINNNNINNFYIQDPQAAAAIQGNQMRQSSSLPASPREQNQPVR